VRSHAKASPVGSNSGPGARLGSFARLGVLVGVIALAFCLLPAAALGAETRVGIETLGSFPEIQPGAEGPGAVAVDQGTNDVYVAEYDGFNHRARIERFDENGDPADFSALSSNEIGGFGIYSGEALGEIAVDSTSHDFYVADNLNGVIKAFKQSGEPSEFTAGPGSGSNELPGFSEVCGVAVDSNGDIYMGDYFTGVHVYAPDGEEVTSFEAEEACNVAVDSSGAVYVARYVFGKPGVAKFTPSQFPVTASTTYTSAGDVTGAKAYALAVDPGSGDLYVDTASKVKVFDSSGTPLYEFGSGITGSEGVAVDDTSGKAYAADRSGLTVQVYGPPVHLPDSITEDATEVKAETAILHGTVGAAGGPSATCEFQYTTKAKFQSEGFAGASTVPCSPAGPFTGESKSAVSAEATGLTPGVDYRFRLAATSSLGTSFGTVDIFHTPVPPLIESVSVEAAGTDNADLGAVINPKGGPTTYMVEFGTTTAYGLSSPTAVVGSEGDETPHTVSVHVAGLVPGTAYHFRFVAVNGAGTTEGADTPFATYSAQQSFAPCSNDQFRTGFGEGLPDCRAYEQASPADKNGANVQGGEGLTQASANGDRVTFYLLGGLPSSGGSSRLTAFMASRGSGGWSTDGLLPATGPGEEAQTRGWSEDLSTTLVNTTSGALLLRDSDTSTFESQLTGDIGESPAEGFAADTRHLVFQSGISLLPGVPLTPGSSNLYDLDHGKLTYVGRIPAGSATSCDDEGGPACVISPTGSVAFASEGGLAQNVISRDGSEVFFKTPGGSKIYMREDGERTTWISASQRTTLDPNGTKPANLWAVTPEGSEAFFTSCEKLTDDSTAVSPPGSGCDADSNFNKFGTGLDLYAYDTGSGRLTDLSVDPNVGDAKGADVVGVFGASSDGSYVYFAANGVLAPGASAGNCRYVDNTLNTCNLYVAHGGAVTFVAPLTQHGPGSDEYNWGPGFGGSHSSIARVADDGTLLFRSTASLTGYDNVEPGKNCRSESGPVPCVYAEFYRYVPTTEQLNCVTCNPVGLAPKGEPSLVSAHGGTGSLFAGPGGAPFLTRNLSANGKRVFFQTNDALLPADTNGNSGCPIVQQENHSCTDVYEWEAKGEGSCESESQNGGCLYLISSGRSPDPSYFLDASKNGNDVFFFTPQQLVPGDKDQLEDVYDASVGGGLASQHELTPPTCESTACAANPPPPPPQSLSSASFSGPGNAKPPPARSRCPKDKRTVRAAGKARCVPRHSQKKHHKRARHQQPNINRGGSK